MKHILLSIACLLAAALVPTTLKQSPQAAAITNFQGRGLDRFTQKTVRGPEVVTRIKKLRAKNKGLARAMHDLERKGLRPALDQSTSLLEVRSPSVGRNRSGRFLKASFQSETYSDDGYEMTLISYDDGDPNTWEGVIYEHDPDGNEYEYTASLNISGEQENWSRIVETYYPADGGEPASSNDPEYYYYYTAYQPGPLRTPPISGIDSIGAGSPYLMKTNFGATPQRFPRPPGYPIPPRVRDRVDRWLKCTAGGCTVSAIGCIASGPGWPACFGWWCAGSGAGCVILTW